MIPFKIFIIIFFILFKSNMLMAAAEMPPAKMVADPMAAMPLYARALVSPHFNPKKHLDLCAQTIKKGHLIVSTHLLNAGQEGFLEDAGVRACDRSTSLLYFKASGDVDSIPLPTPGKKLNHRKASKEAVKLHLQGLNLEAKGNTPDAIKYYKAAWQSGEENLLALSSLARVRAHNVLSELDRKRLGLLLYLFEMNNYDFSDTLNEQLRKNPRLGASFQKYYGPYWNLEEVDEHVKKHRLFVNVHKETVTGDELAAYARMLTASHPRYKEYIDRARALGFEDAGLSEALAKADQALARHRREYSAEVRRLKTAPNKFDKRERERVQRERESKERVRKYTEAIEEQRRVREE